MIFHTLHFTPGSAKSSTGWLNGYKIVETSSTYAFKHDEKSLRDLRGEKLLIRRVLSPRWRANAILVAVCLRNTTLKTSKRQSGNFMTQNSMR